MYYARTAATFAALTTLLMSSTAMAASDADVAALQQEVQAMKSSYETRIRGLENKLAAIQKQQAAPPATAAAASPVATPAVTPPSLPPATAPATWAATPTSGSGAYDNRFNPAIGVILDGTYGAFSQHDPKMPGFAVGDEGIRGRDGLSLGESELNFSANIDDKFSGQFTASVAPEDGEDHLSVEEAFVQTNGGVLPDGLSAKAGRFLADIGYINSHHQHTDDFADRPLPYRSFINNEYNDDGVEVHWVLPTDLYTEVGGGVFRGDAYPYGNGSGGGAGAFSAFARVGGEIGDNSDWRLGASMLSGHASDRLSNDGTVDFNGDSTLYIADARYNWAPTGNATNQEVTLQGEYMLRHENGTYNDLSIPTGNINFNGNATGWYLQSVYKFMPEWRVGARYSMLDAANAPTGLVGSALDANGFDPKDYAVMADWTNSEFSRVRLQYDREELARGQNDNQFLVQYIMSLGAHGAHNY